MTQVTDNTKAILGLLVTAAIMGGQFAVCKQGILAGLTYQDVVAIRIAVSSLFAVPFCIYYGRHLLHHYGITRMALITILSGAPYLLLFYYAISLAPTAHGAVIVPGSMAFLGAILGYLVLKETLDKARVICLIALFIGLLLMASAGLMHAGKNILLGDALFFCTALLWAIYAILFKKYGFTATEAACIIVAGSVIYLPIYFLQYRPDISTWPMSQIWIQGGYFGILHALLAMPLFAYGVRVMGAGVASMAMALIPAFGLVIALLFMHETPTAIQWVGIVLVISAMLADAAWRKYRLRYPSKRADG